MLLDIENEFLKSISEGNKEDFKVVYYLLYPRIYRTCLNFVRDGQTAEDLCQDCFIKLWLQRHEIANMDNALIGFYLMVNDLICEHFSERENRERIVREYIMVQPQFDTQSHEDEEHLLDWVPLIIEKLTAQQKKIVILKRQHGMSNSYIANKLKISIETVRRHIKDAHKLMRQELMLYGINVKNC